MVHPIDLKTALLVRPKLNQSERVTDPGIAPTQVCQQPQGQQSTKPVLCECVCEGKRAIERVAEAELAATRATVSTDAEISCSHTITSLQH